MSGSRKANAHVFISYAASDRERADMVVRRLESERVACWIAPRNVTAGAPYAQAIVDALARSPAVVVIFSSAANASLAVQSELELAMNRRIPVVAVRYDGAEPEGSAEYYLRRYHWYEVRDESDLAGLADDVRNVCRMRPARAAHKPVAAVAGPFAGRESELAALSTLMDHAFAGNGSAVLVRGESGIGKSALLDRAIAAVAGRRLVVRANNFQNVRTPFGPWIDVLRTLVAAHPGVEPPDQADRRSLARLLGLDAGAAAPPIDRRRLFVIVAELLARAAAARGLVVAFDDLQWADPETIELLDFAMARLSSAKVCFLATLRSDDEASAADVAIGALERYPNTSTLELSGLSERAVRQVIAGYPGAAAALSAATIDDIWRRSDGNPLLAGELVREALAGRAGDKLLPTSVKLATQLRLRAFDPTSRAILECAASIGRVFSPDDLAAVSAQARERIVPALRKALDAGLIEPSGASGDVYAFRHELFRAAVYEDILPSERAGIHRAVAERLEAQPGVLPGVLAYHWTLAGDRVRACTYALRSADDAVAVNAIRSARDAFIAALATRTLDERETIGVRSRLGDAYNALGEAALAAHEFADVARYFRTVGDGPQAAFYELRFAANAYRSGRSDEVVAACERALTLTHDPRVTYGAHAVLASFYANRGSAEAAWKHIHAADSAETPGDARDRLSIAWARAALQLETDSDAVIATARGAVAIAESDGTPELLALTLMNFGMSAEGTPYQAEVLPAILRAIALADERGITYTSAYARCVLARDALLSGNLAAAKTAIVEALLLHVEAVIVKAFVASIGLETFTALGCLPEFPSLRDWDVLERMFASGEQGRFAPLAAAHAAALVSEGRTSEAEDLIARTVAAVTSFAPCAAAFVTFARYGRPETLEQIADVLPSSARGDAMLMLTVVRAIVGERLKQPDRDARAAEALTAARARRSPLLEALVIESSGGQREALAIYKDLGALGHAARLSGVLKASSRRHALRD